jgi:hypothetical protein
MLRQQLSCTARVWSRLRARRVMRRMQQMAVMRR